MLEEGKKAPDFKLKGIDEKLNEIDLKLSDVLKQGRPVILYFYPKDNTPG